MYDISEEVDPSKTNETADVQDESSYPDGADVQDESSYPDDTQLSFDEQQTQVKAEAEAGRLLLDKLAEQTRRAE